MNEPTIIQWILALVSIAAALGVVFSSNAVMSALLLMTTLFVTGAMYIGLGAYFVGAAQILIYAGAIAVLFVFMVMILDLKNEQRIFRDNAPRAALGGLLVLVFAGSILISVNVAFRGFLRDHIKLGPVAAEAVAGPREISEGLISQFMVSFQVSNLLLLGAVMGCVVLARGHKKKELPRV